MNTSAPRVVFIDGIPIVVNEGGHFGLLASPAPCHGYANLCNCAGCQKRAIRKAEPIRQPWEAAA